MCRFTQALVLVLCMGITTLSSCKKIEQEIEEKEPEMVEITSISATLSPITKTELQDGYKVLWSPGDKISVLWKDQHSVFTALNQEAAETAEFSGSFYVPYEEYSGIGPAGYAIYGLYPYSAQTTVVQADPTASYPWSNVIIKTLLPSEQTAVAGSFANELAISVGTAYGDRMTLNNVCGLFEFTLEREDVTKVSFRANNEQVLAGMLNINIQGSTTVDESGAKTVTLSAPEGTYFQKGTPYYFVLAPVALPNGFTLTFTTDSGTLTKAVNKSLEIKSSVIGFLTEVDKGAEPAYVPFADPLFKAYCVENFDTDGDGEISFAEALEVSKINYPSPTLDERIADLGGIEYFTNIKVLKIAGHLLKELDLSNNTSLIELDCMYNTELASLNVSNNLALKLLTVHHTALEVLDVSDHSDLTNLSCYSCPLASLDITNTPALTDLLCYETSIASLDLSNRPVLKRVSASGCSNLKSINLANTPLLATLVADHCRLASLDLSDHSALYNVEVGQNPMTSLNMSNCSVTDEGNSLVCNDCQLTSLILDNASLGNVNCSNNQLTSLDLRTANLMSLDCTNNPLEYIDVPYGFSIKSLKMPEGTQLRYPGGSNQDYSREDWGDITNNYTIELKGGTPTETVITLWLAAANYSYNDGMWVENASEYIISDSASWNIYDGCELAGTYVKEAAFEEIVNEAAKAFDGPFSVSTKTYPFKASAWSIYNIIGHECERLTPYEVIATPIGDAPVVGENGVVGTFVVKTMASDFQYMENAHPEYASRYICGEGSGEKQGSNAGGGLVEAE